jgi:hypothetical protein
MKKAVLLLLVIGTALTQETLTAQVRFNVNINIGGGRPAWGLPGNYAGDYYYFPEIDTYYDIPHRQFVYWNNGNWAFGYELPYWYRGYDLYRGYKVVINEPRPYLRCEVYRDRYRGWYNTWRRPVAPQPPVYVYRDGRGYDRDRDRYYERDRDRDDRDRDRDRDRDHDRGRRRW